MNSKNVFLIPLFLLEIPEVYRSPGSSVRASVLNFWYWFSIFVTLLSKKLYTLFSFFYKLTYGTIPGWSAWFFFGATMLYSVNLSCIHELWTLFCTFVIKNAFRSGLLNFFKKKFSAEYWLLPTPVFLLGELAGEFIVTSSDIFFQLFGFLWSHPWTARSICNDV